MKVIPVIDIKGGVVVHARAGERSRYRAIETPLAKGAEPLEVVQGLIGLFPFDTLYVADLDGIESGAPDERTQALILAHWPGSRVLIDDGRIGGTTGPEQVKRRAVVGSESLRDLEAAITAEVLSLDFRGDQFLGPAPLFETADLWPADVIAMTLHAVGRGEGPDVARLTDIIARGRGRAVYAAGGLRNASDLRAVASLGAAGALVATALHSGQIKTRDLEEIAGESF